MNAPRPSQIRHRVDPGDVPADKAARRLHLTPEEFAEKLPGLLERGFPPADPTTGMFDLDAIDLWLNPASGVYFVRHGEFVKIGWSFSVAARLINLRTGTPHDIDLLFAVWSETPDLERHFHRRFAGQRHRAEWFRLEGELLEFVREEAALRGKALSP